MISNSDKYSTGKRWTKTRKSALVRDVLSGIITLAAALHEHGLSEEEFASWTRLYRRHGLNGLRTTYLGQYRSQVEANK